jgi:hypothetical protein
MTFTNVSLIELWELYLIRTPIPPKPPPAPPKRGCHAGNRGTNERPSPNRPSSSPGSRHRAAPETTTSAPELRPGNLTFSQNTQRPASLPGLAPEHASRNTGFSFFNPLPLFVPLRLDKPAFSFRLFLLFMPPASNLVWLPGHSRKFVGEWIVKFDPN